MLNLYARLFKKEGNFNFVLWARRFPVRLDLVCAALCGVFSLEYGLFVLPNWAVSAALLRRQVPCAGQGSSLHAARGQAHRAP